jgi:hypothetical protein
MMDSGDEQPTADQPGVRPLDPYAPEGGTAPRPRKRSRRSMVVATGVAGALVVAGVAGAAWLRNEMGSPLGAADSIPQDADLVVTVDFLHFTQDGRLDTIIDAVTRPMLDVGTIERGDLASIVEALSDEVLGETGISLTEDVVPWVGRSAALAVVDLADVSQTAASRLPSGLLVAIDVRDHATAEQFVTKLVSTVEDHGGSIGTEVVDGHTVYVADSGLGYYSLTEDTFLVASDDATLRSAFDAESGSAIADTPAFQRAMAALDPDRGVSFYMRNTIPDLIRSIEGVAGAGAVPEIDSSLYENLVAVAGAAGLVDDGFWAETKLLYDGDAPALIGSEEPPLVSGLPAGTYFYLGVAAAEETFADAMDALRASLESAGVPLGPYGDVLGYLDGRFTLAVVPADSGLISSMLGADVGIVGGIGIDDPAGMRGFLEGVIPSFAVDGVEVVEDGEMMRVFADGAEVLAFSITEEALAIGTSAATLGPVLSGGGEGLTTSALYRDLDALLPGDGVDLYVDVEAAVDAFLLDDPAVVRQGAPFQAVRGIGGSTVVEGDTLTARFVLLFDVSSGA